MTDFVTLHPLTDFIDSETVADSNTIEYCYEGRCPQTGVVLSLPRTRLAEAIAHGLMQHLTDQRYFHQGKIEGKMYGVLLVETPVGMRVLKAFSGLLNGHAVVEGWVPPIPGRDRIAFAEALTLDQLETIKQTLITLQHLPEREQFERISYEFEQQLQQLKQCHQRSKLERQQQRQELLTRLTGDALKTALEGLDDRSRYEGIELRRLKQHRDMALQPLKQAIAQADARIQQLKQRRKELSRQLQTQMYETYRLTNFAGQSVSLHHLMPNGFLPTGTGDCCAPKLLHYAATHGLKPVAMAEFWWGPSSVAGDKMQGAFYGACAERCQPIMGFLLSGLPQQAAISTPEMDLIYEDEWLLAVNKPAGLLSVPGRYGDRQDSVVNRLQVQFPEQTLRAVHRLDQDTSGILLVARDLQTYRAMSQQFQQRQVQKVYEAVLTGRVTVEQGVIELPLWGNPDHRPYQTVDERGKLSITHFRVLTHEGELTRVELIPLTGRTHQLRVHAADVRGLGMPIRGDRLYGDAANTDRLYLHARELVFKHPHLQKTIHLKTQTPFFKDS
ncbi:RluA family pseudouridine synthase [Oscillatoria sp. FACHB-1407]|uniref:RluA family pseudouridine synthase n=1 Tax=Oscillatoria sp. FACHB-1407 TaxID=2692847 RepID=UPI0016822335|nr:pseudouridine synthase [Oscillatoria sp. FACHB-1407]MBD2461230.1 RluA family pseudouridine synthase [Oscillatoria sp. FACHB-1407]